MMLPLVAVGTCALVIGSCMAHMLSPVVRCVVSRRRVCLAMLVCRDQVSSWSVNTWCWHKVFVVTLHVTIGEVLHGNLMSVSQITRKLRIRVLL